MMLVVDDVSDDEGSDMASTEEERDSKSRITVTPYHTDDEGRAEEEDDRRW